MTPPLVSQLFPVSSFSPGTKSTFSEASLLAALAASSNAASMRPSSGADHARAAEMSPILPFATSSAHPSTTTLLDGISEKSNSADLMRPSSDLKLFRAEFDPLKHFLTLKDLSVSQILHLIARGLYLKLTVPTPSLEGKSLALLFTKRSTRTRVSAESAWAALGGHPMFLGMNDVQIGGGESWMDTAIVIGRMANAILCRCGPHEDLEVCSRTLK